MPSIEFRSSKSDYVPRSASHDIDFKVRKARQFLGRKHKLKINVLFKGRENAHRDRGRELLEEVIKSLDDVATIEQPIKMEGRTMSVLLSPSKTGSK